MTASAQLGNRCVALNESAGVAQAVSGSANLGPPAVRTRPRPAHRTPLPPAPVPPAPAPPAAARLPAPRTGRMVALLATVAVTFGVVAGLSRLGQSADPAIPERTAVIRVGAGETVWDVAARVAPRSDPRAVVERIRQLNGLTAAEVVPDQQLQVPDGR